MGGDIPMRRCQFQRLGHSMERTFEQLSHVKIVPRFFPFFVAPPITPAFESDGGGVPEILKESSTGTETTDPISRDGCAEYRNFDRIGRRLDGIGGNVWTGWRH
jgi:hypothetical protein